MPLKRKVGALLLIRNVSESVAAIARIDRMGQTQNTEVYCYYSEGRVV